MEARQGPVRNVVHPKKINLACGQRRARQKLEQPRQDLGYREGHRDEQPPPATGIVLQLGTGIPTFFLGGSAPINALAAPGGGNGITGNDGDNVVTVTGGVDAVNGGLGHNTLVVDYSLAAGAVTGDSTSNFSEAGGGGRTVTITNGTFQDFRVLTAAGAGTLTVGNDNNFINAGNGANTITAGSGANTIIGGSNADTITVGISAVSRTVAFCTKIPLDTPLARLVAADPAIEVIGRSLPA